MAIKGLIRQLRLSLRLLARDWRSGELFILVAALIIAVAGSTTIILFADRLNRTMEAQAAEFLGADLVVSGHQPIPQGWLDKATEYQLEHALVTEFPSVIVSGKNILLTGVKAVSSSYPLRGQVFLSAADGNEITPKGAPERGTAWVDLRVLNELKLKLGDTVNVGRYPVTITHLIAHEPDRKGDFFSLSPRVMINYEDVPATGVIQPGSRVHYFGLFAGAEAPVLEFKPWLEPLLEEGQRLHDVYQDRPELGNALVRAEQYLGLASVVVVLISGVAIAMASRRYAIRHYDLSALLRCFGASQNDVLAIFLIQVILLGMIASMTGFFIGWAGHGVLLELFADYIPEKLHSPSLNAMFLSIQTGLIVLLGFSLFPILRQRAVSPIRVLRRDFAPLPPSRWSVFGVAALVFLFLVWRFTNDIRLTLTIFAGGSLLLVMLTGLTALMLGAVQRLSGNASLSWRIGLRSITHHRSTSLSQILAFSITLMAMLIIILVRTDLIDDWKQRLPENAPNYFAINIFPEKVDLIRTQFAELSIDSSEFYPIVRGRLTHINEQEVKQRVTKDSQGDRAINRDLSLTWGEELPEDNPLVSGRREWLQGKPSVSVEKKLADSLKIAVGDELRFAVAGEEFTAIVNSLREVQWDTMKPNFYMIFAPGVLDNFPTTYLTSFYLSGEHKADLAKISSKFPAVTILDVDAILTQVRALFEIVSSAVELILVFALLAGLMVLLAAVYASLDARLYDAVMMRTLGAEKRLLRVGLWVEFVGIGVLSGLLAALATECFAIILYHYLLKIPFHFVGWIWAVAPLVGAVIVGVSGYFYSRRIVTTSPVTLLRQTQ